MEYLTPYQIADRAEKFEHPRSNRAAINKMLRAQDDSNLWPISGKFNVTERAIRLTREFERKYYGPMCGLEYALYVYDLIGHIVNNSNNW